MPGSTMDAIIRSPCRMPGPDEAFTRPEDLAHKTANRRLWSLGLSMVPEQFEDPQWQAQIFFSCGVWRTSKLMP